MDAKSSCPVSNLGALRGRSPDRAGIVRSEYSLPVDRGLVGVLASPLGEVERAKSPFAWRPRASIGTATPELPSSGSGSVALKVKSPLRLGGSPVSRPGDLGLLLRSRQEAYPVELLPSSGGCDQGPDSPDDPTNLLPVRKAVGVDRLASRPAIGRTVYDSAERPGEEVERLAVGHQDAKEGVDRDGGRAVREGPRPRTDDEIALALPESRAIRNILTVHIQSISWSLACGRCGAALGGVAPGGPLPLR